VPRDLRLGGVDLAIISAGTGHNGALHWELDVETVTVNVLGFMAVAQVAMRHFLSRGRGHLVGISSIAALRGNRAACYAASKAFQSVYLDGLRDLARHSGHPIVVTEVQPGGVDTAMLKPDRPLPAVVRRLFVASPAKAARQTLRAVRNGRSMRTLRGGMRWSLSSSSSYHDLVRKTGAPNKHDVG
jgi:short-subunit dehydrogenase